MHYEHRIAVEPRAPARGQTVRVEYRGLLAQSGADSIWMHCGFDGWNKVQDVNMSRSGYNNFSCTTKVEGGKEMNLCFKDSADHWDNNSGHNWTIPIR